MKERIRSLMMHAKLTQQDFALRLEISAASLSNIFNGKTNPTNTHVCAVHKAFPNVNINWLLFGEGNMFLDGSDEGQELGENVAPVDLSSAVSGSADVLSATLPMVDEDYPSYPMQPKSNMHRGQQQSYSSQAAFIKNEKSCEKTLRKVKEIRVFYDDGTYESFIPTVK